MDRPEIMGNILDKRVELNAHARASCPDDELRAMVMVAQLFTSITA